MKLKKVFFILIVSIAFFQNSFGQEIDFEGNWFREIKGYDDYYTSYDFRFYNRDDVIKAKRKYNSLKQLVPKNEWEGIYSENFELGASELFWNSTSGFIYYHVYHTLSSLDFGSASDTSDSVKLISEKSLTSKRKAIFSKPLVKVKFGNKHFLLPEDRLQEFTDSAAGLSVKTDYDYYFYKINESENKVFGLPILPAKYRHFLRFPIVTEITRIGNRRLYQSKLDDGTINYEEIHRFVNLKAGKNKKIKVGMFFWVEELGEWIEVTKVSLNSSIGKITREADEKKQEQCRIDSNDGRGQVIPCKLIKLGMKVKTKVSDSSF